MSAEQALDRLRRDTLALLKESVVLLSGPPGIDTTTQTLGISDYGDERVRARVRVAPHLWLKAQGIPNDQVLDVDCYWTPMRPATAIPAVQRKSRFARHRGTEGAIDLWFTPQMSGCTVLVADWGGQVGLVHLQPYTRAQYSCLWGFRTWSDDSWRRAHRDANRSELTAAVAATGGTPARYILIETLGLSHVTVLGVRSGGTWDFYVQRSDGNRVIGARLLDWERWSAWVRWAPAAL